MRKRETRRAVGSRRAILYGDGGGDERLVTPSGGERRVRGDGRRVRGERRVRSDGRESIVTRAPGEVNHEDRVRTCAGQTKRS
jgi:hypothetical protein